MSRRKQSNPKPLKRKSEIKYDIFDNEMNKYNKVANKGRQVESGNAVNSASKTTNYREAGEERKKNIFVLFIFIVFLKYTYFVMEFCGMEIFGIYLY
ncbi:hypothetical protein DBV15_09775 [Temnothorax longispinosus]|uniref:Uncharacterized protein n=1 Tax=Temnothorax longispinosus TaxID=300112 RepID=A0A4S2KIP3_9HYME|nr:hypothetical protein DBV15_09775 [Temnothorax longispinosus]